MTPYSPAAGFGQRSDVDDAKIAWERFKAMDGDGDGLVSVDEAIGHGVTKLGLADADMRSNLTWWDTMDANTDGILEPAEFDQSLR